MPVYEYECAEHGVFESLRSIREYALPCACPTCAASSLRVMSVPTLSGVPRATMVAHDRNERSRHEPRMSATPGGDHHGHSHSHGAVKKGPDGRPALKQYSGKRPWVIEHG